MASSTDKSRPNRWYRHRAWAWLALPLASASCTPMLAEPAADSGAMALVAPPLAGRYGVSIDLPPALSAAAPEASPVPRPLAIAFEGRTALDRLRSHDCLAQAIFYEAASESEEGQEAVAQVVLNRVRHPSWPNSVCGVVYQGPLRPGGGCQFSFTCDGSLTRPAVGPAWEQARRLAGEALAGRSRSSVGLATHYHTHAVSPAWAPRLASLGSIGAHIFYRLPGRAGEARAFRAAYSGSEPLPRPAQYRPAPRPSDGLQAFVPEFIGALSRPVANPAGIQDQAVKPGQGPAQVQVQAQVQASTVREAYRHSGQWRADAPRAITGRSG